MIADVCKHLRNELSAQVSSHTNSLVRGTGSRDEDQYLRGKLYGLQLAISEINALEDRIRQLEESDADE